MSEATATFQGRLHLAPEQAAFLSDYAERYSRVERVLYADMRRSGARAAVFKNTYLVRFGITARQFNAIARNLEGKIASVLERLPDLKAEAETRIAKAQTVLGKIRNPAKRHQKKRRRHILETRLAAIEQQIAEADPRICFGSGKLFRAQFDLEANGYADHAEWRADWQAKRASQFYVLGSKDENAGCQGCVLSANLDGSFTLRLRSLTKEAHYLMLEVRIPYGHDVLREALRRGQAISYRFLRDAKGWRVFITTTRHGAERLSLRAAGAIGVDVNADCLAVSEIDRHGNLVGTCVVPLITYGKNTHQTKAAVGEAVKAVLALAEAAKKPVVVEKLDFAKKKSALEGERARLLSSLGLQRRPGRFQGARPAGRDRGAGDQSGLHLDHRPYQLRQKKRPLRPSGGGSCYCSTRLWFPRAPGREEACVPTPKGDHLTFCLPARNRQKHVWSFWASARKTHLAVLAAHLRPPQGEPSAAKPTKSKCPRFTVRSRDANHRQNCLVDVM